MSRSDKIRKLVLPAGAPSRGLAPGARRSARRLAGHRFARLPLLPRAVELGVRPRGPMGVRRAAVRGARDAADLPWRCAPSRLGHAGPGGAHPLCGDRPEGRWTRLRTVFAAPETADRPRRNAGYGLGSGGRARWPASWYAGYRDVADGARNRGSKALCEHGYVHSSLAVLKSVSVVSGHSGGAPSTVVMS